MRNVRNASIDVEREWTEVLDTYPLTFRELIRQAYSDLVISAGTVEGHPVDTLYLMFEQDGVRISVRLMRPDEAAAIAWCMSGVMWSELLSGGMNQRFNRG